MNNRYTNSIIYILKVERKKDMGDVIIKCFQTPKQKYFYDRHLNSVVGVTEEEFEVLQKIEQTGKFSGKNDLKRLTDRGLLKESIVKKIEHPDSLDLKYFSEHKINDLILQVIILRRYCHLQGDWLTSWN